jgi:hypothetical protein
MSQLNRYKKELRKITAESNAILFQVVDDLLDNYESGRPHSWSASLLGRERDSFLQRMLEARNAFVASNQAIMMHALYPDQTTTELMAV